MHKLNDINVLASDLRTSQKGAVGAIIAHLSVDKATPALVVMPTGSGKTAVINLCPILSKAEKTLVITSSKLVRSQIAEEFSKLSTLKKAKAFSGESGFKVLECKNTSHTSEEFNDADIVIGIPTTLKNIFEELTVPRYLNSIA